MSGGKLLTAVPIAIMALSTFALIYTAFTPLLPEFVIHVRISSVEYEDGKLLALSLTPRGLSGTMLNLVPGWANYPVKLDEVLDIWLATGELAPVPSATISIALTRNDTLCQVSFSIDSITLIAKYLYETEGSIDDKKIVETYINDPLAGFRYYPRLVVTVTEDYLECRKVEENQGS